MHNKLHYTLPEWTVTSKADEITMRMQFSAIFTAMGGLSLILGILILLWHLTPDVYVWYVSNMTPGWPSNINSLNNTPLPEYLLIFLGILSIGLTPISKKSGYLFVLLSLGMVLTSAFSGFPFGGPVGGFPLSWWWTTLGSCAFCRHPYFIMLFPFLIDWVIWTSLAAVPFSVVLGVNLRSSPLKAPQTKPESAPTLDYRSRIMPPS